MRWPGSFPRPAVVVAESLRPLPEAAWPAGITTSAAQEVAGAIASHLTPPQAAEEPPRWLRPAQGEGFRRALACVRQHGGAMVADPVGSGKSWVALAVARALAVPTTCVVPAPLVSQWQRVAREAGVAVTVQSHESWGRATRPLPIGLVIVDESHRFRHPATRRYRHLASALLGQRVLLLSASPVVNRLEDLLHQLLLGCRDDALAAAGTGSLTVAVRQRRLPSAIADLVIRTQHTEACPAGLLRHLPASLEEDRAAQEAWETILGLRLSPDPAVRRLMRTCLAYSLASGVAATLEMLHRYRTLLLQAQDGARAGVALSRRTIHRTLLGDAAQTVLWSLFGESTEAADISLDDLERLDAACTRIATLAARGEPKVTRLRALLADGTPTIVFCGFRATVHALRRQLTPTSRVAWCTGDAAGIGTTRLARDTVLGWFRPGVRDPTGLGPRILVTTDVASEGLDLQHAARVVHYDLPWTAVRLEQRAGRVARLGSSHAAVEVIQLQPPRLLEAQLGLRATLARKRRLARWGDDDPPRMAWDARPFLAAAARDRHRRRGVAVGTSRRVRAVVAFECVQGSDIAGRVALVLADGQWRDDPDLLAQALQDAEATGIATAVARRRAQATLQAARRHVERAVRHGLDTTLHCPEQVRARRSVRQWARLLGRLRHREGLDMAERAHAVLFRGLTAAERAWADAVARATQDDLARIAGQVPAAPRDGSVQLRLVGCIHFEPPPS